MPTLRLGAPTVACACPVGCVHRLTVPVSSTSRYATIKRQIAKPRRVCGVGGPCVGVAALALTHTHHSCDQAHAYRAGKLTVIGVKQRRPSVAGTKSVLRYTFGVGQRVEAQPPSAAANDDAGAVRAMHEDNVAATRRGDAVGACVASPGGAGAGAAAGNSSEPGSSHHSGASPVPTPANRDTSGYDSAQQSPSGDVDMENVRSDEQAAALAQ